MNGVGCGGRERRVLAQKDRRPVRYFRWGSWRKLLMYQLSTAGGSKQPDSSDVSLSPPEHLERIYQRLIATYGEPRLTPDGDPLGGLIGTMLSQHTSDANAERAYERLIAAFRTWEEVRDAPPALVVEAIRCGGLANIKARRIQEVLRELSCRQEAAGARSTLSQFLYEELERRPAREAWEYLQELPGVGPKTAACVLLFNLGRPVMPVDTHVYRVAGRLGLIGPGVSAEQAHLLLAQLTPPAWVYALHVNLIRHGRRVCLARRPHCLQCALLTECRYAGSAVPASAPALP
jgi:endonuclease-3